MASLTRWTWVWVGSGSWWSTGKSGVLQSMGQPRVIYDCLTDWTEQSRLCHFYIFHPPSAYKNSCPLIVVDGGIRLLTGFHLSTPVASIQQKASFSFHKPCLFIGFEWWAPNLTVRYISSTLHDKDKYTEKHCDHRFVGITWEGNSIVFNYLFYFFIISLIPQMYFECLLYANHCLIY